MFKNLIDLEKERRASNILRAREESEKKKKTAS